MSSPFNNLKIPFMMSTGYVFILSVITSFVFAASIMSYDENLHIVGYVIITCLLMPVIGTVFVIVNYAIVYLKSDYKFNKSDMYCILICIVVNSLYISCLFADYKILALLLYVVSISCIVTYIGDEYFTHYTLISSGILMPFVESFNDIKTTEINGIINHIKKYGFENLRIYQLRALVAYQLRVAHNQNKLHLYVSCHDAIKVFLDLPNQFGYVHSDLDKSIRDILIKVQKF